MCSGRGLEPQTKTTLGPNIEECPVSLMVQRWYRFQNILHVAFLAK
jgi:hypothetical protein